jgi:protein-disulfide isomerase
MKLVTLLLCLFFAFTAFGQKPDDAVATATGHTWTVKDLSPDALDAMTKFPGYMSGVRSQLLAEAVGEILLETEAKARAVTVIELLKLEAKKVKDPTLAEIKAVYDSNADRLAGQTLEQVRPQIVEFLRRDPEEKAIKEMVDGLALKYKVTYPKDVNAVGLKPTDVLFAFTGGSYTDKLFEDENRLTIYNVEADFFDNLKASAEETVYNSLVLDEAKALKIDSGDLIAREITSKMKDYTEDERAKLQDTFRTKLFTKYNAQIVLKEPDVPVQTISVDDDPAKGAATAPVTIVMFSDFQCSACSGTHPLLTEAMAAYADKIRFVVRDYPLETLHPNAFHAALAANAANAQGKFFEYIDVLYKNQKAQDDASLKKYAADLGLNAAQFALDFTSEKTAAEVRKDMADGRSYGVSGTPTIFVKGRYVRVLSVESFKKAIETALGK